ncbi:MAG: ABC transporter substrate-binding protein, partial [bacterium]
MRRARFVPGIFAALAFIGLVGGGALPLATAWAAEKITFSLGWVPNGRDAAFFTAKGEGFYREAGLDVNIIRGYGGADVVQKVG